MTFRIPSVVLWVVAAACCAVSAEELAIVPEQGVLLLRNGNVIQGGITRVGDQFVVTLGKNGEMRLPASSVARQAQHMDELYFARLHTLDGASIEQRFELARWCVRQKHFSRAADQILAISVLDPDDPRIAPLQRQVQMASAPVAPEQTDVQPIAWASHEIEETIRELPVGVIETFTKSVQPMLLNRCASCHHPYSTAGFRLLRASGARTVAKRLTQRNLAATLATIDLQRPNKSPLLLKPSGPHGNVDTALFDDHHRDQFKMLRDWVSLVAGSSAPARPDTEILQANYAQQSSDAVDPSQRDRRAEIARSMNLPDVPSWAADEKPESSGFQPKDPFDPEIFNRQHFGDEYPHEPSPDKPERLPPFDKSKRAVPPTGVASPDVPGLPDIPPNRYRTGGIYPNATRLPKVR